MNSIPIMLFALTNIRVLKGQSVADVTDLQLVRDNLGYIYIPATSLKGSITATLYKKLKAEFKLDKESALIVLNALFGTYDDELKDILKQHVGAVAIRDAKLVFIPATSEQGIIFLTTPLLLEQFFKLVRSNIKSGNVKEFINSLMNLPTDSILVRGSGTINLAGGITLNVINAENKLSFLEDLLKQLFNSVLGVDLTKIIGDFRVGIIQDDTYKILLNKMIIIRPGIKVKGFQDEDDMFFDKSVSKEGPRFEEEIPKFSVFISEIKIVREKISLKKISIKDDVKNKIFKLFNSLKSTLEIEITSDNIELRISSVKRLVNSLLKSIVVGGKETLGRGLVALTQIGDINLKISNINLKSYYYKPLIVKIPKIMDAEVVLEHVIGTPIQNKIREKNDELKGKFSALPERFRMLGPITALMFYRYLKESTSGKGYPEVVKVAKLFMGEEKCAEGLFGLPIDPIDADTIMRDGRVERNRIKEYLENTEYLVSLFTLLKYIIRSYPQKKD